MILSTSQFLTALIEGNFSTSIAIAIYSAKLGDMANHIIIAI